MVGKNCAPINTFTLRRGFIRFASQPDTLRGLYAAHTAKARSFNAINVLDTIFTLQISILYAIINNSWKENA